MTGEGLGSRCCAETAAGMEVTARVRSRLQRELRIISESSLIG